MMSRVSTVVMSAFVVSVAMLGCKASVSVETKTRYVDDPQTTREAPADWAGEDIVINDDAVGISVNGGLKITADPSVTKVTATSRIIAMAYSEDKTLADQSIAEAKDSFKITTSGNVTTVECHHGGSHGSSDSGSSGCELMEVKVPIGSTAKPINIKGLVGNGGITVSAGSAILGQLSLTSNGGDVDATVGANQGSEITASAEKADNVTLHLPSDFAADSISLNADANSIDTTAFPDVKSGSGRGTAGTGAKSITLTSREFAGSTGKVTLAQ
jgi:hypothetical protein